jgi:hypothetical protein
VRRLLIAALLLAAAMPACSPTAPKLEPSGSRIRFRLQETLAPAGRSVSLIGATEQIYGCANVALATRAHRVGSSIEISVLGIVEPEVCLTSTGPAMCTIPLGTLPSGTYSVSITAGGQTTVARLEVTDQAFTVLGGESRSITFPLHVLHRVPPGTIWGIVGYSDPSQEAQVLAYVDALRSLGAKDQVFAPGDYGEFQVGALGVVETPQDGGFYYSRAYLFRYAGDPNALAPTVRAIDEPIYASLYDDRGDFFYSWGQAP